MATPCEYNEADPVTNHSKSDSQIDDTPSGAADKKEAAVVDDKTKPSPEEEEEPAVGSPSLSSVSTVPPSSPPQSPLQSVSSEELSPTATNNNNSHHVRSPVRSTPQMMVLGKDGSDYRDLMSSQSASKRAKEHRGNNNMERQQALLDEQEKMESFVDETSSTNDRTKTGSWWKSLWHGKRRDDGGEDTNGNGDDYTSMEHAEGVAASVARRPQPTRNDGADVEAPMYYHNISESNKDSLKSPPPSSSLQLQPRILGNMHTSLLRNLPLPATKEDQILHDCSFLYRPVDEGRSPQRSSNATNSNNRRGMRAIVDLPPDGVATMYRHAQDVLSPPAVAQYQAKYHQLNQVYAPRDVDRFENFNENDYSIRPLPAAVHELTLEEQQEQGGQQQQGQHSLVTSVTTQSSLFYQHEVNGRVVLRLPRDHVHLMVASPNDTSCIEPGILSVIQCRRPDDPPGQQLEYCLTVQPNLYQRVISEITQYASHSNGGGGLDSSFYASEHADIRIAIGIMTVISFVLGISTLVYGLD